MKTKNIQFLTFQNLQIQYKKNYFNICIFFKKKKKLLFLNILDRVSDQFYGSALN